MSYSEKDIKVLNSIQHIQLRRGMYIGNATDPSCLFSEIFDNAIDEVTSGYSSKIIINVDTKKNRYTVRDFGRGFPHGLKTLENGDKKETIEVIMTIANSGGKFDNASYKYSSGLHGVGTTVTNALSSTMTVTSYRDDKSVSVTCEKGIVKSVDYGIQGKEKTGSEVSFIPNGEYFETDIIPIEFMADRCKIASALGFNAELYIDKNKIETSGTMFDLIKEGEEKVSIYKDIDIIDVKDSTDQEMKVVIRYTSDTKDKYFGFANMTTNYLGGTHVQYLSKVISEAWVEFIDKHKNLKPLVELRKSDYAIGLRAVCAVFITNPAFSSQTKEKLTTDKKELDDLMNKFKKQFKKYLEDNILVAQQLIKRFEEYRIAQNNLLSRKEISSIIKVNNDDGDNIRRRSVVSKLVECTSKKKKGTEMFIVEGDSAMGPYLYVRDKETQAILPIRGKIKNITFKDIKEVIQNKEICDIANSIGCGIGSACDASKSRYERIIISADADPDGEQINCLVLTVFVNMFPDLVKQGMVYLTIPPLYCWGNSVKDYGWCNSVDDIPANAKNVHRFKGLGEMNNDQLDYFLANPKTRNIMQVDYPSDIDEFNNIMGTSTGKNELLKSLGILA